MLQSLRVVSMLGYLLLSFCETSTKAVTETDFERLQAAKEFHSSEYNKIRDAIAKTLGQRVPAISGRETNRRSNYCWRRKSCLISMVTSPR